MARIQPTTPAKSGASAFVAAPSGAEMTSDMEIGQSPDRVLRSTGDAKDSLDAVENIKIAETIYDDEKMAMLAFMNETIEIRVATTSDPNAEQVFEININGRPFLFKRGETKVVPRYVADRLARMKVTRYTHAEVLNNEGIKDVVYTPITSLKYDFMVTKDGNRHGDSWLRSILAERG
jgi:hypothetical protein